MIGGHKSSRKSRYVGMGRVWPSPLLYFQEKSGKVKSNPEFSILESRRIKISHYSDAHCSRSRNGDSDIKRLRAYFPKILFVERTNVEHEKSFLEHISQILGIVH